MKPPDAKESLESYRSLAAGYDKSCRRIMPIRHEAITLLQLKPGDTVLDVASGTGLSIPLLVEAVGPSGHVVAIEHSPEMMALARQRVRVAGWQNVTLIEAQVEEAVIPMQLDAVLFHFTHDVLQSRRALDNIFGATQPNARVAVAGAKLTSWWQAPLNLWVLWRARRYLTTYDHLQMPWHFLAYYVPGMVVELRLFNTIYVSHGVHARAAMLDQTGGHACQRWNMIDANRVGTKACPPYLAR